MSYFRQLDGLRAFAITLVIVEHFGGPLGRFYSGGYYGVDLFFVISGFLITSILLKNQHRHFSSAYKTFMGRRVLRIFPIYYLALLIFFIVDFSSTRSDIAWLVTYTWNYQAPHQKNELFYLWSLSVEEQYYLFWPLLVLFFRNRLKVLFSLTLLVIFIGYGQLLWNIMPLLKEYNYTGLVNRMGSLGTGSAGAIAIAMGWKPRYLYKSIGVEIIVLVLLVIALVSEGSIRLPILGICSLVLVLKSVNGGFQLPLINRVLSNSRAIFIGRISYGIYIIHWPLGIFITLYLFDPIWLNIDFSSLGVFEKLRWNAWVIKFPIVYLATIGVAYLSFRYFEKPFLDLKDKYFSVEKPVAAKNALG